MGGGNVPYNIANSGTIRPGNSIGTLTVTGNYIQNSTGTLEVEISPISADKLAVTGSASLNGALVVQPETGTYTPGTQYEILTASGGVSGQFASTSTQNATRLGNLSAAPKYESNRVLLVLSSADAASAAQQQATTAESAVAGNRASVRATSRAIQARVSDIFRSLRLSGAGKNGPAAGGGALFGTGGPRADRASPQELAFAFGAVEAESGLSGGAGSGKGIAVWTDSSFSLLDDPEGDFRYSGWLSVTTLGADTKLLDDRLVVDAALPAPPGRMGR